MVKPATTDMTISGSADVHIRAEALHAAHIAAIEQCTRACTGENLRNVAAVGRELAKVYRELAGQFCESAVLFHAMCRARDQLTAEVKEYDQWADEVRARRRATR